MNIYNILRNIFIWNICTAVSEVGKHKCADGPLDSAQQNTKVLSFRLSAIPI